MHLSVSYHISIQASNNSLVHDIIIVYNHLNFPILYELGVSKEGNSSLKASRYEPLLG